MVVDRYGARAGTTSRVRGRARSARTRTSDEPARAAAEPPRSASVARRVLERREVARQQEVERAARPGRRRTQRRSTGAPARSSASASRSSRIGSSGLWSSSPVITGERIGVEDREQLVSSLEAEQLLEVARPAQNSWFSPPKTSDTESSVKIRRIESVSRSAQESTRMFRRALRASGSCP